MDSAERFRCEPYRTVLSRAACAAQFTTANDPALPPFKRQTHCVGCKVGKAHAAGLDAPDVEVRTLTPHASAMGPGRWTKPPPRAAGEPATATPRTVEQSETSAPQAGAQTERTEERMAIVTRECTTCGKSFEGHSRAKYCSLGCKPSHSHAARAAAGKVKPRHRKPRANGSARPAIPPPADTPRRAPRERERPPGVASARELLEFFGYTVRDIATPAGPALLLPPERS